MTARLLGADGRRAAWERLVEAAWRAAEHPEVRARRDDFRRAADSVFSQPFPSEERKPFHCLVGFGRSWSALSDGGRATNAAAVKGHALACARLLGIALGADLDAGEAPPGEPPPRRPRADIDG